MRLATFNVKHGLNTGKQNSLAYSYTNKYLVIR